MKRLVLTLMALAFGAAAFAQSIRPEWDLRFQGTFINDEFDVSNQILAPSGTLGAARISPYVGLIFADNHRIKAGFDLIKDFGTEYDKPLWEPALWYQYDSDGGFRFAGGIFPYALLGGFYSTAIWSDASRFYDAHVDGFLVSWTGERSLYEICIDWFGKYGDNRREQFLVMSYGKCGLTPWLSLNWEGMFHHFASSDAVKGVVDDHFFHPYVQFEFSPIVPLDRLELSLGGMIGYQCDRDAGIRYIPKGADAIVDIRKWGFGVRNQFYYGESQAPFFHATDASGAEYGTDLYIRSSWWQIRTDGKPGLYDRLDAYWMKSLNDWVDIGFHAVFHFDYLGLLGTQQMLQASVNLEGLRFRRR